MTDRSRSGKILLGDMHVLMQVTAGCQHRQEFELQSCACSSSWSLGKLLLRDGVTQVSGVSICSQLVCNSFVQPVCWLSVCMYTCRRYAVLDLHTLHSQAQWTNVR